MDTAEVDTAEAAHIIQFIGGEKAASLLTSCDARQAAEYVAAMDFSDQSVQTVLKYLDSETGSTVRARYVARRGATHAPLGGVRLGVVAV